MRVTLKDALRVLETAAAVISVVVPATRNVANLLEQDKPEEDE